MPFAQLPFLMRAADCYSLLFYGLFQSFCEVKAQWLQIALARGFGDKESLRNRGAPDDPITHLPCLTYRDDSIH